MIDLMHPVAKLRILRRARDQGAQHAAPARVDSNKHGHHGADELFQAARFPLAQLRQGLDLFHHVGKKTLQQQAAQGVLVAQ